ncbi:MAG TPA: Uma2 family endonuclease [Candidatus Ozemobacteraceae bacterium]|nr:Uma2 family endonuclease [Candidatus Ozemobacteraceae bacterium]
MPRPDQAKNNTSYTYGDYLSWPDEKRSEIIDGEIYDMTPAPTTLHQVVSGNLFGLLWTFLHEKPCKVFHAPFDVRLPKGNEADESVKTVVQPDMVIVCDEKKMDERGMRGAPDIAVEILSPSTASRDHILKRRLYERHGVKEYWLIDPTNRIMHVYRTNAAGTFDGFEPLDDQAVLETPILPGLSIRLKDVFPKLPPKVVRQSPKPYKA